MRILIHFLILAALLGAYYQLIGPAPTPSELYDDLEWWRSSGLVHRWEFLDVLDRLAEEGYPGAFLPLGIFLIPPILMLVWGFKLFRSALLRTLAVGAFLLLGIFVYYGYMFYRPWRFFEWRFAAVAATFAGLTAATLFAPSLLRAALDRSRIWAGLAAALVFAGIFVLSTEVTGTDSFMRFNISPWPVVTVFGLLLVGSTLSALHCAAGLGSWLAARVEGKRGLTAGVLVSVVLGVLLVFAVLHTPPLRALILFGCIAGICAFVRARSAPDDPDLAARAALTVLAAGVFAFATIDLSDRGAGAFQTKARNVTATRVLVALERYKEGEGHYPERLRHLVPDFFEELPRPRMGLILDDDDEFTYTNLGDSYLLEFSSVQWVQCGYSPPYDFAAYSDEDFEEEEDEEEDDYEPLSQQVVDPELEALLADHGLEGAWNCADAPPRLW